MAAVGAAVGLWQWWNSVDIKSELSRSAPSGCFQHRLYTQETACTIYAFSRSICSVDYYAGKRVIITGASRGIGRSMALQLAQLGAK